MSERYDFDRLRAQAAENGWPRAPMADSIGGLHISTRTYNVLRAAGIERVSEVRDMLAADALGDVAGIGPTRVSAIAEAVDYYDERRLPDGDPTLRELAAGLAVYEAIRHLAASAVLQPDRDWTEAVKAFVSDEARQRCEAWLRSDGGQATRQEGGYYLRAALAEVEAPPDAAPSGHGERMG